MRVWRAAALLALLVAAPVATAQTSGPNSPGTGGEGYWGGRPAVPGGWAAPRPGAPIAEADAGRVVNRLNQITAYCGWFGRGYEIDCLRDQYEQMRRWLPETSAYAPLRQALWQASRDLAGVVRQHGERTASGVAPPRGNPTSLRASRALTRTTGGAAAGAARAVIDRTATVLLRSASASDPRRVAFQRMAQAIGSSKVLLRSRA